MADQGLVIGWHQLVGPLIEQSSLVRFTDLVIPAPGGYHLTWNSTRKLSYTAMIMRDWIREQAQQVRETPGPVGSLPPP